ncbi:MAG: hypothetical protein ACO4AD_01660 [Pseudomonadales bacterium]
MARVSATRVGRKARVGRCAVLVLMILAGAARAYPEETLQTLTFTAAKAFNRCVEGTGTPRLSALQVRNLVLGNVAEGEAGVLRRATRWGYYDRAEGEEDRRWLWLVSTRLHDRFEDRAAKVLMQDGVRATLRYEDLGSVLYYLQRVTIPANVVPIFHPRPWRWPSGDRFTDYPINEARLSEAGEQLCEALGETPEGLTFDALLEETAGATLDALRQPIADMQSPWYAFWELGEPGRFGRYGEAGNRFGRATSFPCGTDRCQLLDDDPIYATFAAAQHRLALLATMRGILLLQRDRGGAAQ